MPEKLMTADEARKLTDNALRPTSVAMGPWMDVVMRRIKAAAKAGKRSVVHPFDGIRMPGPDWEVKKAIRNALQQMGYEWIDHPNPDPGHPASRPYIEIKW